MTVKSMIETYVNFELSEDTWEMFYQMYMHNIISYETWGKFFMKCKSWTMTDDGNAIIDYDSNMIVYKRDDLGFLVKVK